MSEPDSWRITVADDVADEIGMGGTQEKVPDVVVDWLKDIGMGSFASSLDGASAQLRREIEFFGTA